LIPEVAPEELQSDKGDRQSGLAQPFQTPCVNEMILGKDAR
jgi:hypothetical protein